MTEEGNSVTFNSYDNYDGTEVFVSRENVELLDDYLRMFTQFLNGVGFSYVYNVVAVSDDGQEFRAY